MNCITNKAYFLCFKSFIKAHVICHSSHGNRQLAYSFQIYWLLMCRFNECIHPPVCSFGQQIDKGLQESDSKILKVLRGFNFFRPFEENVSLKYIVKSLLSKLLSKFTKRRKNTTNNILYYELVKMTKSFQPPGGSCSLLELQQICRLQSLETTEFFRRKCQLWILDSMALHPY